MNRSARPPAPLPGAGLIVPRLGPEPFELRAVRPSPCAQACPAGINVKSYVSLIAEGRFAEALDVVRERCPLPGVCGRICHHPCEAACHRGDFDQPVAIRALKRFVADLDLPDPPPPAPVDKPERVAVIGSGPAGLTAAHDLRRSGYRVTVFEAEPKAGGMLRYGIADYRLPVDALEAEIGVLERAGVEIETGWRIGVDQTLEELLAGGFDVVLLAVGAQRGRRLRLAGEESCAEVEDALAFLRRVNRGDREPLTGKVLVIGGGSTAIEAARAARRLGAEAVEVVYRRQRAEMPADEEEIDLAAAEGIGFRFLTAPKRVEIQNGRLASLECLEVALGEEDASGRRRPIVLPETELSIACDRVFAAVGQEAELDFLPDGFAERLAERGLLAVDRRNSMTALRGVFAAGDVVSGPSTVIDAIAAGHRAADAIFDFLQQGAGGERPAAATRRGAEYEIPMPPPPLDRRRPPHDGIRPGDEFAEVERAFLPADAVAEAQRCLRCGPCAECLVCASSCGRRHLSLRPTTEAPDASTLLRAPAGVAVALEEAGAAASGWLLSDLATRRGSIDPATDLAVSLTPTRVTIDPDHCRGCARCLEVCSFEALHLVDPAAPETTVEVDAALCRGCNLCAGVCPTDAVLPSAVAPGWWGTRLEDLHPRLAAGSKAAPPLVVLACRRRAGAVERSLARSGAATRQALLVPVRCTGQLPAGRLLEIYRHGAGAIVVAGCSTGSCRYGEGTRLAARQVEMANEVLDAIGLATEGGRIAADWADDQDAGLDSEPAVVAAAATPARVHDETTRRPRA